MSSETEIDAVCMPPREEANIEQNKDINDNTGRTDQNGQDCTEMNNYKEYHGRDESLYDRNNMDNTRVNDALVQESENVSLKPLRLIDHMAEPLEDISIPPIPPAEWQFNNLIVKISSAITDDELEQMKELFRGPRGIGKKVREKCNTAAKFFGVLRENAFISPMCMLYLNKMLYAIRRIDLIEKVVQYCRAAGNVLYYIECISKPEDGYEFVKYHVQGGNFAKHTKTFLQTFRNSVASIVCASPDVVILAGIEPGSSLLVILMLPTEFVTILQTLLNHKEQLYELEGLDVDIIYLRDQAYYIDDKEFEISETDQELKLMNIFEQNRQLTEQLQNVNLVSMQRHEELELIQDEKTTLMAAHQEDSERLAFCFELLKCLSSPQNILLQYYDKIVNCGQELTAFNNDEIERLENISRSLTEEDRELLKDYCVWHANDIVKTCVDKDTSLVLIGLMCKEAERKRDKEQIVLGIKDLLVHIDRRDLVDDVMMIMQQVHPQRNCGHL